MSAATLARAHSIPNRRQQRRARVLGVAGATVAAMAVWLVAVRLFDVHLLVRFGGGAVQSVGVAYVFGASLLGSLVGWAVLAMLETRSARAVQVWTAFAVVALLLSLALPLTFGITVATRAILALMHVTVAGVIISMLRR